MLPPINVFFIVVLVMLMVGVVAQLFKSSTLLVPDSKLLVVLLSEISLLLILMNHYFQIMNGNMFVSREVVVLHRFLLMEILKELEPLHRIWIIVQQIFGLGRDLLIVVDLSLMDILHFSVMLQQHFQQRVEQIGVIINTPSQTRFEESITMRKNSLLKMQSALFMDHQMKFWQSELIL